MSRDRSASADLFLRCNGTYTFRITDPIKLYTNVTGNVAHSYSKEKLRDTMKAEFISARGISDVKVAIHPPTLTEEDQKLLKTAQETAMYRDPTMAAAENSDENFISKEGIL